MNIARRESWDWLLDRLENHRAVASVEREGDYVVHIEKTNGSDVLLVFCDEYFVSLQVLDAARLLAPRLSAIVTSSVWNSYSTAAKEEGLRLGIGVFRGTEIIGALHKDGQDFVEYLSGEQRDAIRRGRDPY